MAQHGIETILMRRLASQLTMPIVLVDPRGDLVFFNAAAAAVIGRRFEDTGAIARGEWSAMFRPANPDGSAIKREDLPLFVATERREPSHRRGWVLGLDGVARDLEGIAFPLVGQGERMLGAVGWVWNPSSPPAPGAPGSGRPLDLATPGGDRPVELLLMRQLASYLKTAILLIGPEGSLLFYNEPAERLLGRRFDEAEPMNAEEWSALLHPTDEAGRPIDLEERPMIVAWRRQQPAYRRFSIRGFDGVPHPIEGLAFPLVGGAGRQLGAVGIFWDRS
jgi:PAS domain-containing protein